MEELEKNVLKVFNSTKSDFTNYLDAKEIILKEIKKTDDLESLLFFCYDLIKYEDDEEIINDFNKVIEKIEREIRTKPWNSKEVKTAWKKAKNMSDLGQKGIDALKNVDFKNMLKIDGDSNGSSILCHVNYHGGMNEKEMDKFEKMVKDSIGNQYIEDYDWNGMRKISLWIKKDAPVFNTK